MRTHILMLAASLAILALVLEAVEPFTDVEEARPANADACDNTGRGSCPMAMIQRMIQPSSVSFSGSAKVTTNVHFGSTADLNEEGYRGVLSLRSKHELKIWTRRLAQAHDFKVVLEEQFNDFIAYKVDSNNGMNFNSMLDDLNREATKTCSWLVDTKKVAPVDGSSAPLTETGYREVADLRSHLQMNKFIQRVIDDEGFFLKDSDNLDGMTLYHSCERDSQSLQKVRDELRGVASSPNGWVTVASPPELVRQRLSAMSTSANVHTSPSMGSSEAGIGITARLNEEGYQNVVRMKSNIDMSIFVLRAVSQMDFQVVDEDKFNGMVPFYSGDKGTQSFAALKDELRRVNTQKCAWIGPKDDDPTEKVTGKNAKLNEEGYVAVARLYSPPDMKEFIHRLLRDMKMEVVDQGGVMGLLPFHDCEKGSQSLKDLRQDISKAAEQNTWVRIDAHEATQIDTDRGQGDEVADAPRGHENVDQAHGMDAAAGKNVEAKDQDSASPSGGAAVHGAPPSSKTVAASSKDHEATPPSKTLEDGAEPANKAGIVGTKSEERSHSAHGEDASGTEKQLDARSPRHAKGVEEARADDPSDAAASSRKDHEDQNAHHSKGAAAAAPLHTAREETTHNEDAKVASSQYLWPREDKNAHHSKDVDAAAADDDNAKVAPSSNRWPDEGAAHMKMAKGASSPNRRRRKMTLIKLDTSWDADALSTMAQPDEQRSTAHGIKTRRTDAKFADKTNAKGHWASHPNIESLQIDGDQAAQLLQLGERLDDATGKDDVSTTKQPDKPTAKPKEKEPSDEKSVQKKEAKHKLASHPNIESLKNDDDQGEQLVQVEDRLVSSRGRDDASTTKQPDNQPTAAPKEEKPNGIDASPKNDTAHDKPPHKKEAKGKLPSHPNIESMKNDDDQGKQLVQIGERLDFLRGEDDASTTKHPDDKSTAAPKEKKPSGIDAAQKDGTAQEKPAHTKEPEKKLPSHPNIESMKDDDDQGKQLVQVGERLDFLRGEDDASTTKHPDDKPTAAPKEKKPSGVDAAQKDGTAQEKAARTKEAEKKLPSHPNIESMKNDDDQGKQLVQVEERLDSSRRKDYAATAKQLDDKPTAAPKRKKPSDTDASLKNDTRHEKPVNKNPFPHPNIESMKK